MKINILIYILDPLQKAKIRKVKLCFKTFIIQQLSRLILKAFPRLIPRMQMIIHLIMLLLTLKMMKISILKITPIISK